MSAKGVARFIAMVALCFPKPRFEDERDEGLWTTMMVKTLHAYEDAALEKAADTILRTRDRKKDGAYFPVPKECIEACENAQRVVECKTVLQLAGPRAPEGYSAERHKLAIQLMGTALGEEALRGRWHGALYDFIYRYARLPTGSEVGAVKQTSREFFEALRACEHGERGELSPRLLKLGRSIAGQRDKIVREIDEGSDA